MACLLVIEHFFFEEEFIKQEEVELRRENLNKIWLNQ
jgi:hypothetical protein